MPKTTKKIKYPEDPKLGKKTRMDEFVTACNRQWSDQSFEEKTIDIKEAPTDSLELTELRESLLEADGLSFQIQFADINKIFEQLTSITTNPTIVAELLKDLDKALGDVMLKNNVQFGENDLHEFLIAGKGHYIPGPPPEHYHPKKKESLLDTLLLEREGKNGINVEGDSPKFIGAIDGQKANPFVVSGHIFTEDKQVSRLLIHGSFSHRIMFDAILQAKESGKLDLTSGDGKELTVQQLLELLVYTKYYLRFQDKVLNRRGVSLWELTLDTVVDSVFAPNARENYLNENHYSFSCRSPFVLNSLLLNFGEELGLPHLQHYLLDSHWKAAYEMVYRVKNAMPSTDIPDSTIYTYCMEALTTAVDNDLGEIGVKLPFTLTESEAQKDSGYTPFNSTEPIHGIVKKTKKASGIGEYASWQEFYDHLNPPVSSKPKAVVKSDVLHDIRWGDFVKRQELSPVMEYFTQTQMRASKQNDPIIGTRYTTNVEIETNLLNLVKAKTIYVSIIDNEAEIFDKFIQQNNVIEFNNLLKSLQDKPEQQNKLLDMFGSNRLISLIEYSFELNETFEILSSSGQSYLIALLGTEHLQKVTNTNSMLTGLLGRLASESRTTFLNTLGKDKIIKLFSLTSFLVETINAFQKNGKTDAARDLLNFLGDEPIYSIQQGQRSYNKAPITYHRFESWQGTYDSEAFKKYFSDLKELMTVGYGHILQITNVDKTDTRTVDIVYNDVEGWAVISSHLSPSIAITSKDSTQVAQQLFSLFANNNDIIKLSTQFCVSSSLLEYGIYDLRNKQKVVADQQVLNSLSFINPGDSNAQQTVMRQAFNANNRNLCEKLIEEGINFYTCNVEQCNADQAGTFKNLFNSLCEEQAKFNILKLKNIILNTDWEIKLGGKEITGMPRKVSTTIAAEWHEVLSAEQGGKTYHEAWKTITELRKNAAEHNDDKFKFFRKGPAKQHYSDVVYEPPVLELKN